jgi:hypothetical protein
MIDNPVGLLFSNSRSRATRNPRAELFVRQQKHLQEECRLILSNRPEVSESDSAQHGLSRKPRSPLKAEPK